MVCEGTSDTIAKSPPILHSGGPGRCAASPVHGIAWAPGCGALWVVLRPPVQLVTDRCSTGSCQCMAVLLSLAVVRPAGGGAHDGQRKERSREISASLTSNLQKESDMRSASTRTLKRLVLGGILYSLLGMG